MRHIVRSSTALSLVVVLSLGACGKSSPSNSAPRSLREGVSSSGQASELQPLRTLLASSSPNLALAEVLTRTLGAGARREVDELMALFTPEELRTIVARLENDNKKIRNDYLFHGERYQDEREQLALSHTQSALAQAARFPEAQLTLTVVAELKERALEQIIAAYDQRAAELAQQLIPTLALELRSREPRLVARLEEDLATTPRADVIERIATARPMLELIDAHFRDSNLSAAEQYTTLMAGILAGALYQELKRHKTFQELVRSATNIIREAKELRAKAREFSLLVNTLQGHVDKVSKSTLELSSGLSQSAREAQALARRAGDLLGQGQEVEARRIYGFLHGALVSGKPSGEGAHPSVLSQGRAVSEGVQRTVHAALDLSQNLGAILETTQRMAQVLGVKLPREVEKAVAIASKVSAVASSAKSVIAGFAAGGYLGALGAFSSSPVMKMMMGGGDDGTARQLAEINRKLDQVLRNQQKIMELQLETMGMIKNLALMVEGYHQEELRRMAGLRSLALVNLEVGRSLLNRDLRSCETMVGRLLSSSADSRQFPVAYAAAMERAHNFHAITQLNSARSALAASIRSQSDLLSFLRSSESDGFTRCQSGLANAFGTASAQENPLLAIFQSSEAQDLMRFQLEVYRPLRAFLQQVTDERSLDSVPLHLPLKKVTELHMKRAQVIDARLDMRASTSRYQLQHLISGLSLERYLGSLVLLHPYLEFERDQWSLGPEALVQLYLQDAGLERGLGSRGGHHLRNALKLTQSAIAQEALLAGEPLIPLLYERFHQQIVSPLDCSQLQTLAMPSVAAVAEGERVPFVCALRSNALLMQNYLSYVLLRYNSAEDYQSAFERRDSAALARMLGAAVSASQVVAEGDKVVLRLGAPRGGQFHIPLPRPQELKSGDLLYSENLGRLLAMQEIVLEELALQAPVVRDYGPDALLKILISSHRGTGH